MSRTVSPLSSLAHPVTETFSAVAFVALAAFLALTTACGSEGDTSESRDAEDAMAGRFNDDTAESPNDDNVPNDDTSDDEPADDNTPVVDDGQSQLTYGEWLAAVMTTQQVMKCKLGGTTSRLDLMSDGQAFLSGELEDMGTWSLSGEHISIAFEGFLETSDPTITFVLGDRLLTLETPSLSCDLYLVPDLNAFAGLLAHCDYQDSSEIWFTFYENGQVREYEEYNIQVDTLMNTKWGAVFFIDDTLVLSLLTRDYHPIRYAKVYSDGIQILDNYGNVDRSCFFE